MNSEQRHHWESYQFEVRPVHSRFIARTLSESILCNQHYAEPCFALHHASVSISGLFERRCLDHWADIRLDAEGQRVLTINGGAGKASVDRPTAKEERQSIQLNWIGRCTDHNQLPPRGKT